jgi:DNA-binding response OmpR family regulator
MAHVLLIDDEVPLRSIIAATLKLAGHSVAEADNGREGIAQFRANRPDLVITDIVMPHKEGVETIMELRHDFPDVKIIAISGAMRSTDYLKIAGSLGAKRVLTKPFSTTELLRAVEAVLGET